MSVTKGRGTAENPPNRFEPIVYEPDPEADPGESSGPKTQYFRDAAKTILSTNDSPDVGFSASVNPYRGCEHGCVYCYARPTHEYFGLSSGIDFESKIFVKEEAPRLLREALASPRWTPQPVAMSGITDCYQPIERKLQITRGCLEVLAEFRNPVGIVTKNHLVTRDVDLLGELARFQAAAVFVTVTTLDAELAAKLEPRASVPARRLAAIEALARAGVPVGVMAAPVIPGLTDIEIPSILAAARAHGAQFTGHTLLRLPYAVSGLFTAWMERHVPLKKDKVLSRIRAVRGGALNDPRFGSRMRGEGIFAEQIHALFAVSARKVGLNGSGPALSAAAFRRPGPVQLSLFE